MPLRFSLTPGASAEASSAPTPTPTSNRSTASPLATDITDVRYFDVVHSLILRHIKRANSDAVLALLSVSEVRDSPMFRLTCTYREGLVAALLLHVMEHTGQTAVTCTGEAEGGSTSGGGGGQTEATPSAPSASPSTQPTAVAPLTAHDLHGLLYHCVCPDARDDAPRPQTSSSTQQASSSSAPAVSAYAAARSLLLSHWESPQTKAGFDCGSGSQQQQQHRGDCPALQDGRDLRLYLCNVIRDLETMIGSVESQPLDSTDAFHATTVSPHRQTREDGELPHLGSKDALSVDLAALVAVLQEHLSSFTYVNPFTSQRRVTATSPRSVNCSGISSDMRGATTTPLADVATSASARDPSSLSAAAVATTKGGNDNDVDDCRSSTGEDEGEVDAVTMLQRLPALSATRWMIPSAAPTAGSNMMHRSHRKEADTVQQAAAQGVQRKRSSSAPLEATTQAASAISSMSKAPTQQSPAPQRDTEQARVSAAIRAFDAFTAALEQHPQEEHGGGDSGYTPAQRQRVEINAPAAATGAGAPIALSSAPRSAVESCTASAGRKGSSTHRPPLEVPAKAAVSAAPAPAVTASARTSVPRGNVRVIRRRHKFSAAEDSAIVHGVATFGQGPGAFSRIFDAYHNVWLAGRKAIHLYDHWRGALRRRAVAAVSDEVVNTAEEHKDRTTERGRAPTMKGQGPSSTDAPSMWAEQELSSDIVDSAEEDSEA
ncbi:putative ttaggg binding factor [Leptomonas seymouri]|uniref:Putative ttaggg binding factor n=1 Tax=Leptomonas seymouri TaxID=5684 RepID=A0A0N1HWT6_LEPSE|nr:putative ttaggg binding factor [Leptomonas seymouri]|eukprot:KPI85474.1 putative ttaggg binding factor [Leptomonas seymouri]